MFVLYKLQSQRLSNCQIIVLFFKKQIHKYKFKEYSLFRDKVKFQKMSIYQDSNLLDSLQLNKRHSEQNLPSQIRLCQCSCVSEIQQNQKIIQLQREYTKTLELQNLRRNQQRISLQSQIKQLRLELEQPRKEKQQLTEKIRYYKRKCQDVEGMLKKVEKELNQKDMQYNKLNDEVVMVRNQNNRMKMKEQMHQNQIKQLRAKLQQMYKKLGELVPKQRRQSFFLLGNGIGKGQQNLSQIIDKMSKKWDSYGQQIFKKHKNQIHKMQQKYLHQFNQINQLKTKVQELSIKLKEKQSQLNSFLEDNKFLEEKYQTSQREIKSFRLILEEEDLLESDGVGKKRNNRRTRQQLENKIGCLERELKSLKERLVNMENVRKRLQSKHQFDINLKSAKDVDLFMKKLTLIQQLSLQTQTEQIFFESYIENTPKYQSLYLLSKRLSTQLQQKKQTISSLQKRIKSIQKIRELYQQKQNQLTNLRKQQMKIQNLKQRQRSFSHQTSSSSLLMNKQNLEYLCRNILGLNDIAKINQLIMNTDQNKDFIQKMFTNSIVMKCNDKINEMKVKVKDMERVVEQKEVQILNLEETNSNLKKLKIQALESDTKILALKRENYQLKKAVSSSASNNGDPNDNARIPITSRNGSKTSKFTQNNFSKSQASNNSHSRNLSQAQQKYKTSMIQLKIPNQHGVRNYTYYNDRSYLTSKNTSQKSNSRKQSSDGCFVDNVLNNKLSQKKVYNYYEDGRIREFQDQELVKNKVRRIESYGQQRKQKYNENDNKSNRKHVNFCLQLQLQQNNPSYRQKSHHPNQLEFSFRNNNS